MNRKIIAEEKLRNQVISCFKNTTKKMLKQDPKLMELYLISKPTIKKCFKENNQKGLEQILSWLIIMQRKFCINACKRYLRIDDLTKFMFLNCDLLVENFKKQKKYVSAVAFDIHEWLKCKGKN